MTDDYWRCQSVLTIIRRRVADRRLKPDEKVDALLRLNQCDDVYPDLKKIIDDVRELKKADVSAIDILGRKDYDTELRSYMRYEDRCRLWAADHRIGLLRCGVIMIGFQNAVHIGTWNIGFRPKLAVWAVTSLMWGSWATIVTSKQDF